FAIVGESRTGDQAAAERHLLNSGQIGAARALRQKPRGGERSQYERGRTHAPAAPSRGWRRGHRLLASSLHRRRLQRKRQIPGGFKPLVGILLEAPPHDAAQTCWHGRRK